MNGESGYTKGGGEILDYLIAEHKGTQWIDWNLVKQFVALPYVKVIIVILLLVIATFVILRMLNIKSIKVGKGLKNEILNRNRLRDRDALIIKCNKILGAITKIIENSLFRLPKRDEEYLNYNLKRAGFKSAGGYRFMTAQEYNAITKMIGIALVSFGVFITMFISSSIGVVFTFMAVVSVMMLPNMILRRIVISKDNEIRANFADLYLMLHYTLMVGGSSPIDRVMKSYAKTTDSKAMLEFVDNCVGTIDTYGELNSTLIIAKDYREIAEVGKLMRLISQLFDGAEIQEELVGFREELMKEKRYAIEKKMDKLVGIARKCFNILMIILAQAILSAMTVYMPDLGILTTAM